MTKKRIILAIAAVLTVVLGFTLVTINSADANVSYPNKYISRVHTKDPLTRYLPNAELFKLGNLECRLMRRGHSPQQLVREGSKGQKPQVVKIIRATVPAAALYLCPGAGGV